MVKWAWTKLSNTVHIGFILTAVSTPLYNYLVPDWKAKQINKQTDNQIHSSVYKVAHTTKNCASRNVCSGLNIANCFKLAPFCFTSSLSCPNCTIQFTTITQHLYCPMLSCVGLVVEYSGLNKPK